MRVSAGTFMTFLSFDLSSFWVTLCVNSAGSFICSILVSC